LKVTRDQMESMRMNTSLAWGMGLKHVSMHSFPAYGIITYFSSTVDIFCFLINQSTEKKKEKVFFDCKTYQQRRPLRLHHDSCCITGQCCLLDGSSVKTLYTNYQKKV
jgi:hypothetical protein